MKNIYSSQINLYFSIPISKVCGIFHKGALSSSSGSNIPLQGREYVLGTINMYQNHDGGGHRS